MNIQHSYNVNFDSIFHDVKSLESLGKGDLKNEGEEKMTGKLKKLQENLVESVMPHLKEVNWCVTVLDPEQDKPILDMAFSALNELQTSLQDTRRDLENLLKQKPESENLKTMINGNLELINQVRDKFLEDSIIKTHTKMMQLADKEGFFELPSESKILTGDGINPAQADLTLRSVQKKGINLPSKLSDVADGLVFSPGKFYNFFPKSVNAYIASKTIDSPEAKKDIISLLKGEELEATPSPFLEAGQVVNDKYGEHIDVPLIFAKDLPRSNKLDLNKKPLWDKSKKAEYNPNEVARALYKTFGKEGADRLMYVCNQACMPYILERHIYPMLDENGKFHKLIPRDQMFMPSQASGLVTDLNLDEKSGLVKCTIKLKMKLHTNEDEKKFNAYFVVKREITLPLKELTAENFNTLKDPTPNLHVTDYVTNLVINNPPEADELFHKF